MKQKKSLLVLSFAFSSFFVNAGNSNENIKKFPYFFSCGSEALELYAILTAQEVDREAAFNAAMEYYNNCAGQ